MKLLSNDELIQNGLISPEESELYHHGVKGMKWGIRRYQPYSTVPRESGKGGVFRPVFGAAKKAGSGLVKIGAAIKDAAESISEAQREAKKQQIIKSKSLVELSKHMDLFTDNEIKSLKSRIDLEKQINDAVKKQTQDRINTGIETVEKMVKGVQFVINAKKTIDNKIEKNKQAMLEKEKRWLIESDKDSAILRNLNKWSPKEYKDLIDVINKRRALRFALDENATKQPIFIKDGTEKKKKDKSENESITSDKKKKDKNSEEEILAKYMSKAMNVGVQKILETQKYKIDGIYDKNNFSIYNEKDYEHDQSWKIGPLMPYSLNQIGFNNLDTLNR